MSAGPDEPESAPRADLADAVGWTALGVAVLAGSWTMDRLENQDVPPFAAPGLLPGLLGIVLVLMGGLLMVRSAYRPPPSGRGLGEGGPSGTDPHPGPLPEGEGEHRIASAPKEALGCRALGVIGLCVLFGGGLVGHGLPFWVAAALFVTVAILFLRPVRSGLRAVALAAAVGLGAGVGITLLFQQLFLVRLP